MNGQKLAVVIVLGLFAGLATLLNGLIALGAFFLNGFFVALLVAGKSRARHSFLYAVTLGLIMLVLASALVGLAQLLVGLHLNLSWPVAPKDAMRIVWFVGGFVLIFWTLLGVLLRGRSR